MKQLGLNMEMVKAVFISHEHGDHIRGVESIASKHKLPVYFTPATFKQSKLRVAAEQVIIFKAYEPVQIGGLSILPFPKLHDAIDPHSFVVSGNGVNIGVFTDIGAPCEHVIKNFKHCHAIFLEANYDDVMLENGRYPYHLKKRITGEHGHLSNLQARQLFAAHRPTHMTHIYLSHLSKDNNDPDEALRAFSDWATQLHISVASRYEAGPVYVINASESHKMPAPAVRKRTQSVQISLF